MKPIALQTYTVRDAMEKDLVGLYLSGHPLENLRKSLDRQCTANASNYRDLAN